MANRTPYEWLEDELAIMDELATNEVGDYLNTTCAAKFFLCQWQGLRALQAYVLSAGGAPVVLVDGASP